VRSASTRILWVALAALACGLATAACGSSGEPSDTASSGNPALEFARCTRAHGVPNFPDPTPGGGLQIGPSSGINPRSPAFQAAQRACAKFGPKFGGPPSMSASQRQAALRFAECMRANGVPNFPDPTETAPNGTARVLVLQGMVFALGSGIDPKSPAFRQAAPKCGVRLPR
jgi:hypothetical protein